MEALKEIYAREKSGLPAMPNSPMPIFRITHENGLIDQGMHERLVNYNKARGNSAHDYSMEKAEETLNKVGDFTKVPTHCHGCGKSHPWKRRVALMNFTKTLVIPIKYILDLITTAFRR